MCGSWCNECAHTLRLLRQAIQRRERVQQQAFLEHAPELFAELDRVHTPAEDCVGLDLDDLVLMGDNEFAHLVDHVYE